MTIYIWKETDRRVSRARVRAWGMGESERQTFSFSLTQKIYPGASRAGRECRCGKSLIFHTGREGADALFKD